MYTANTMASAAEALGMTLPGSSSFPAEYPEKQAEADSIGATMKNLLELDLKPRDIMTRASFENAMVGSLYDGMRWADHTAIHRFSPWRSADRPTPFCI